MRGIRNRLEDILEAIAQIEAEASKGRQIFEDSSLLQVWMVHHLMIIGEAVRSIDPAFRRKHPSIPWKEIAGMRNILVHEYFRINTEIVWETIENHLPSLKEGVKLILDSIPED